MTLFIAPLPRKRTLIRRAIETYRGWRFKHSRRWVEVGLYTPDEQ